MIKLEIKEIKGNKYLYFRESLKVNSKLVSTELYVGRIDKIDRKQFLSKLDEFAELRLTNFAEFRLKQYTTTFLDAHSVTSIERLAYNFQEFREHYPDESDRYVRSVFVRYVQGTTAIEGNTISTQDTRELLEHDISPAGSKVSEVYEILNFAKLRDYLGTYHGDMSEKLIRKMHEILMENLMRTPGDYRQIQVGIEKEEYEPPPAIMVPDLMKDLVAWYRNNRKTAHPFELAVIFHARFELVHPFVDGNGRVGRALMNFILERSGYPTLFLGLPERKQYLDALRPADDGDFQEIVEVLCTIYLAQHQTVIGQVTDAIEDATSQSTMSGLVREFTKFKKKYTQI